MALKEKVVKYVGTADVREITEANWRAIEITDQKTVRWSRDNNYTVPAKDLSSAALDYVQRDEGLVVVED